MRSPSGLRWANRSITGLEWILELFCKQLHLHQPLRSETGINRKPFVEISPLPSGISLSDVYRDFMRYIFDSCQTFFPQEYSQWCYNLEVTTINFDHRSLYSEWVGIFKTVVLRESGHTISHFVNGPNRKLSEVCNRRGGIGSLCSRTHSR